MRSPWMIRLFSCVFVGCLMIYIVDPVNLSKPNAITREARVGRGDKYFLGSTNAVENIGEAVEAVASNVITKQEEEDLPRLCRIIPAPVLGAKPFHPHWATNNIDTDDNHHPLMILGREYFRYRCAGEPYDKFMEQHMLPYLHQRQSLFPQWGHRPFIVPPKTNQPQKQQPQQKQQDQIILFIGNSHTLQLVGSLLCQYSEHILHSRQLQDGIDDGFEYQFVSGLRIFVLLNHGAVYSHRWQGNLEDLMGVPLFKVDTIVLGYQNVYIRKHHTTELWKKIRQYGNQFPQYQVDTIKYPRGFSFPDLARHYKGNIVWVSMWSVLNQDKHKAVVAQMETITNNTGRINLHAINGRHHVVKMGGIECSSNNHEVIASCNTVGIHSRQNGHRCMGYLGGEPDLLAYDVVETLWKIFGTEEEEEEEE